MDNNVLGFPTPDVSGEYERSDQVYLRGREAAGTLAKILADMRARHDVEFWWSPAPRVSVQYCATVNWKADPPVIAPVPLVEIEVPQGGRCCVDLYEGAVNVRGANRWHHQSSVFEDWLQRMSADPASVLTDTIRCLICGEGLDGEESGTCAKHKYQYWRLWKTLLKDDYWRPLLDRVEAPARPPVKPRAKSSKPRSVKTETGPVTVLSPEYDLCDVCRRLPRFESKGPYCIRTLTGTGPCARALEGMGRALLRAAADLRKPSGR